MEDDHADIYNMFGIPVPTPESRLRMRNEVERMKEDMHIYLMTVPLAEMRRDFLIPRTNRLEIEPVKGDTTLEKCRHAIVIGGANFLADTFYLNGFDMAEQLRFAKLNMLSQLISRDDYFRPRKSRGDVASAGNKPTAEQEVEFANFLGLPHELIKEVFKKTPYFDAKNLAAACSVTNNIYQGSSSVMLLPDITLILDFTNGDLEVHWDLENRDSPEEVNPDRRAQQNQESVAHKQQLLLNATVLVVQTATDFTAENIGDVRKYIGVKKFKQVFVKGDVYTENMKRMIELFDMKTTEIEVNQMHSTDEKFPMIKAVKVNNILTHDEGNQLFENEHILNITCTLQNVDTLRKALEVWDAEKREIGRWIVTKPFSVFQTPFGRRHRKVDAINKGYLVYVSELDDEKMAHGETTEYLFTPIN